MPPRPSKRRTPVTQFDEEMMRRALRLARRGEGRVEPNPMVGCVIVKKDRIIGEGFHRRFGGPHAEINALESCTERPRGSTVYVNLEPCTHFGKTPPCVDALLDAHPRRVVIAMEDPNPLVGGRGVRRLRAEGIEVASGVLAEEAVNLLAPYLTRIRLKRPYVIAKWAQSLDGRLATVSGQSQWISGETSRREAHRLRARMDAILVGSGTVLKDDPALTARDVPLRRRAVRVVLDSRLRIPGDARLVTTAHEIPTLVFTAKHKADSPKARRLVRHGLTLFPARAGRSGVDLNVCLAQLHRLGVTNLLVEGGPTVLSAFLDAGLIDEARVYVAPLLIGGRTAPSVFDGAASRDLTSALSAAVIDSRRTGADTYLRLRLNDPHTLHRGKASREA